MLIFTAADLGGLLGLFLGGSAISIFEVIDLIVYNLSLQITSKKLQKLWKQKKSPKKEILSIGTDHCFANKVYLIDDPCITKL